MKIVPLTGIHLFDDLSVCTHIYTKDEIEKILGINNTEFRSENKSKLDDLSFCTYICTEDEIEKTLGINNISKDNNKQKEYYVDKFIFCTKKTLINYIGENESEIVLKKFPGIESFAVFNPRVNAYTEFYDLKVALTEIYLANRYKNREIETIFNRMMRIYHYFDKDDNLVPINCNIKIGTREMDNNDSDLTIPNHYTYDSYELSVRRPEFIKYDLKINNEIQDELIKKFQFIATDTVLSRKMRSVLRMLYNTLSLNDKESLIITYATILETLLLKSKEKDQRKEVSIRAACLLANGRKKEAKKVLASWIYYFYSYRHKIVHGGVSASELHRKDGVIFDNTITIIHNIIVDLIEVIIEKKYTLNDIKNIVEENKEKDQIEDIYKKNNGYISSRVTMYYEDEYDEKVSLREFLKKYEPELERKIEENIKDSVASTN